MTDVKSIDRLIVFQQGTPVADLYRTKDGCEFLYNEEFLNAGKPSAALHLPVSDQPLVTRGTTNLPSYFAGLLPEGIMQDAIVRANRLSKDDLFSQLVLTGLNAIGDLTTKAPSIPEPDLLRTDEEAKKLIEVIQEIAQPPGRTVPGLSGIQPKLSLRSALSVHRRLDAILKVENPVFPGILENEAAVMTLASKSGLDTPKFELRPTGFLIHRFDRVQRKGHPPLQIHVEDALQALDRYPLAKYSLDYLEILDLAARLQVPLSEHLKLLHLFVFSHLVGNGDLHAKNVSFMVHPTLNQWVMTPAYDLVCTLPYFENDPYGRHMALPLDEQVDEFTPEDILNVAAQYNLPEKPVLKMLAKTTQAVQVALDADTLPFTPSVLAILQDRIRRLTP